MNKTLHPAHRLRILFLVGLIAFGAGVPLLNAQSLSQDRPDSRILPFIIVDTASIEQSYPILSPFAYDPPRVLIIGDRWAAGRIAAGHARRMDCPIGSLLTPSRTVLGIGDPASELLGQEQMQVRLDQLLSEHWDCIWLLFDPAALPTDTWQRIDAMVRGGSVLVTDEQPEVFESVLGRRPELLGLGIPVSYGTIPTPAGTRHDEGVVVWMPRMAVIDGAQARGDYLNTAVALTSGMTAHSRFELTEIRVNTNAVEHEVVNLQRFRVYYENTGVADTLSVEVRCRDQGGRVVAEAIHTIRIDEEKGVASIPYPQVPVGTYSLDVTCRKDGRARSFAGTTFSVDSEERIESVRLWSPHAPRGDFAIGTVTITEPFREGMFVRIDLYTADHELLLSSEPDIVVGRKSLDFILSLRETFPRAVSIEASFYKNNECVERSAHPFLITDPSFGSRFSLGIHESALNPGTTHDDLIMLNREGVSLIAAYAGADTAGAGIPRMFRNASAAGMGVIADISTMNVQEQGSAAGAGIRLPAFLDTLKAFDPIAVMTPDAADTTHIWEIAPELPVFTLHTGTAESEPRYTVTRYASAETHEADLLKMQLKRGFIIPEEWGLQQDVRYLRAIPWWAMRNGYGQVWWGFGQDAERSVADAVLTPQGAIAPVLAELAGTVQVINRIACLWEHDQRVFDQNDNRTGAVTNDDDESIQAGYYDNDRITCLILVPDPAAQGNKLPGTVDINSELLAEKPYVYDLIHSTYIGMEETVSTSWGNGAEVFAMLPYRVMRIGLTVDASVHAPGDTLSYQVEVVPSQELPRADHVFEITIATDDDDRQQGTVYHQTLRGSQGKLSGTIRLAGIMPGAWRITAREIISGKRAERRFIVQNMIEPVSQ